MKQTDRRTDRLRMQSVCAVIVGGSVLLWAHSAHAKKAPGHMQGTTSPQGGAPLLHATSTPTSTSDATNVRGLLLIQTHVCKPEVAQQTQAHLPAWGRQCWSGTAAIKPP